jgi:hypothetical protein
VTPGLAPGVFFCAPSRAEAELILRRSGVENPLRPAPVENNSPGHIPPTRDLSCKPLVFLHSFATIGPRERA